MIAENKKNLFNDLKIAGFSAYFLLLFIERVLALIFSVKGGGEYALVTGKPFNIAAYVITAVSLLAGTALFLRLFIITVRVIRSGERRAFDWKAKEWGVAATAMLFGGMMHTGFTLLWLQFIAYACLIGAMVVRCLESCETRDRFIPIVSTIYLTLFSMAIPVCYLSFMELPMNALFYVAEFTAVAVLVPSFGIMLARLLSTGTVLFTPSFVILLFILSAATVALGWMESVNYFLLIFTCLTVVFYLSYGLIARRRQIALMKGLKG